MENKKLIIKGNMDYKKKYEEALERAKGMYEEGMMPERIEYIFPELKESEDERIRKAILEHVQFCTESIPDRDKFIAWLKKQGEQPNKVSIWKHWKDVIAGNGDNVPAYLIKNGSTYSISSCLGFECDYIELSELDSLMLEKQGEQKPAWSEEDERCENTLLWIIESYRENGFNETHKQDADKSEEWLESLKERMKGE